jgi:hypothetical protein
MKFVLFIAIAMGLMSTAIGLCTPPPFKSFQITKYQYQTKPKGDSFS